MLKDGSLLRRLRRGDRDALRAIYEKYERLLVTIAANLLDDRSLAEDVLQDVFVSFARSPGRLKLRGSLRAYLSACVANRARDHLRQRIRHPTVALEAATHLAAETDGPVQMVIRSEELERLGRAFLEVPYEQREAVVLRLHGNMKFREIAKLQQVPVKTVLSRYRYGLDRLRSQMNGGMRT